MLLIISMSPGAFLFIGGLVLVAVLVTATVLISKGRESAIYSILGVGLLIAFALLVIVAFGGSVLRAQPVP